MRRQGAKHNVKPIFPDAKIKCPKNPKRQGAKHNVKPKFLDRKIECFKKQRHQVAFQCETYIVGSRRRGAKHNLKSIFLDREIECFKYPRRQGAKHNVESIRLKNKKLHVAGRGGNGRPERLGRRRGWLASCFLYSSQLGLLFLTIYRKARGLAGQPPK